MSIMSLHIPDNIDKQLEALSMVTGKSKTVLAGQAIEDYLAHESWQIKETEQALKEADAGDFSTPEEMQATFRKWGR